MFIPKVLKKSWIYMIISETVPSIITGLHFRDEIKSAFRKNLRALVAPHPGQIKPVISLIGH